MALLMKVLIVDDEPKIREGLKTLIDWKKLNCGIIGEAENGVEGIEKIEALQPDLVIVDIKMPEIDGIGLIETFTKRNINTKFIVLSGYQDFNYAKRAMECKVNHYILKPIEEEILEQKVEEIYEEWIEGKKKENDFKQQCRLSKEQVMKHIAIGHESMDSFLYSTSGYDELNRWYDLKLPWQSYTILLLDTVESKMNFQDKNMLMQYLNEREKQQICFEIDGLIGVLMKNRHFERNLGSLELLREQTAKLVKQEVIIAVGITVEALDEVRKSYAYARYLLDNRFLYCNMPILCEGSISRSDTEQSALYQEDLEKQLYQAVCTGQQNRINLLLEDMRNHMENCKWNSERIKAFYLHVYVSVMTLLIKNEHGLLEQELLNPKIFENFYNQSNLFKLHGFIKYQLMAISSDLEKLKPQDTLNKVIDYIEHHYREDLTIEELGSLFHYSCNYLGKQLKRVTGKPFNLIVDELRINEAKKLLENPEIKIYEVSKLIGFHDPDYFAVKFKKLSGFSPKEYRKMLDL